LSVDLSDPFLRVCGGGHVKWRHWDGELAIYDGLSGETVVLTGIAGMVLELLVELGPVRRSTLEAELAHILDSPLNEEYKWLLQKGLESLRDASLIHTDRPLHYRHTIRRISVLAAV
jgi:hypothetical protein